MTSRKSAVSVGSAIKKHRTRNGLSQVTLATNAGMALSTLRRFEHDEDDAHTEATEYRLCRALGWPEDAFDRIRNGEDPDTFETPVADDDQLAALRAEIAELRGLVEQLVKHRQTPKPAVRAQRR